MIPFVRINQQLAITGLLWVLLHPALLHAQLNCRTITIADGKTTTCRHANGQPSTIETWDKDNRWGSIKGFDNKGNELFSYGLRRVGGHASANITYHSNGQVKVANFTSQPDGGIQYWHIVHEFNDRGEQTYFADHSMPDGRPVLRIHREQVEPPVPPQPINPVEEVPQPIICAIPYQSAFSIINHSKKPVTIKLTAVPNLWLSFSDKDRLVIRPKDTMEIYNVTLAEIHMDPQDVFRFEFIQSRRKKLTPLLIKAQPEIVQNQRHWYWHILEP